MTKSQITSRLITAINKIPSGTPLQDWIDKASNLHEDISSALEGIYCGREGKIHEPLHGEFEGTWLDMGWYTVLDTPKVEYAYFS